MGACKDRSTKYLRKLGYNVIRHPAEGIAPLQIIGRYNGSIGIIGTVDQLVDEPAIEVPPVSFDNLAADIDGERTSKLSFKLGLGILEGLISGLGGNLGIGANYEGARTLQFKFQNVRKDRTNIISLGDYLSSGEIKWDNIILEKFLFGKGDLFVITSTIKSNSFSVSSFKKNGAGLDVDVPAIQQVVQGSLDIGYESEKKNSVSFEGEKNLAFGFEAVEFYAEEDSETEELMLKFQPTKSGKVTLGLASGAQETALLNQGGALRSLDFVSPEELGE